MRPNKGFKTVGVRQRKIEHHDVELVCIQPEQRFAQGVYVRELDVCAFGFPHHLSKKTGVPRIVFDKQNPNSVNRHN